MNTITHDLVQGSPEWLAFRLEHHGASEAAAMLGLSGKVTRSELLRIKHTGMPREFGDWVQKNILDHGHHVEALARPHVEAIIGEDLYPVTCSLGKLSASCDGLTMDESLAFEHKQFNRALFDSVAAGIVPEEHLPQCHQIMLVTGAKRVIFVVSDGTPANMAYAYVEAETQWAKTIIAGWEQFDADLAAYVPPVVEAAPVGKAPETLPALRIEVSGMVTASNLAEFKATALAAISSVNRELTTDQHFADAEKAVKWCSEVETRLAAAKQHALSQTASIDELFRTMDDISAEAKRVRLDLDKLVKARKESIKGEIVAGGMAALRDHIAHLNAGMPAAYMPAVASDFAGAIKSLRTVDSIRNAVNTELARAKIAASDVANRIHANLRELANYPDHQFLFHDKQALVLKATEDLIPVVVNRINAHKAAEAEKEAKRQADEAARIAAAEQRAREQEAARIAAESARVATAALAQAAAKDTERLGAQQVLKAELATADATDRATPATTSPRAGAMGAGQAAGAAPAVEAATLNLGAICGRLGFTVNAAFLLDALSIKPAATERGMPRFTETQFALICRQLVLHVCSVAEQHAPQEA